MDRHIARRVAAVALAAGVVATLAAASGASAAPRPEAADAMPMTVDAASPEMMAALQRDFNLTPDQARNRMTKEDIGSRTAAKLGAQLGSAFGGAWLDDDQNLVVAVTDARQADQVRALGAEPRVVARSEAALNRAKGLLDRADTPDPSHVTGWYVDVPDNTVVVQAKPGARAAANAFIQASGIDADIVRVVTSTESPRTLYDVRGGDAYYMGSGGRCSIGFSVSGGFVTAGHCGTPGTSTSGYNQVSQGTFQGSSFPGNDYAWVSVNSNWDPRPLVNRYSGSQTVTVAGGQEAATGSSVCRSGSTTGWHCGTIQAKNQTVNYPQGTVNGLTRTSACAEPGDSGGSWLTGQQAQGVTSGGSGNCSVGGTTYFQPLGEILSRYGLSLVTSGGGGDPDPPSGCSSYPNVYTGSLSGSGDYEIEPNGSYFYWGTSGTHQGCLSGPSSADFDLYLQKWGGSSWVTVASSTSADSEETLSYNGTAGYYRYIAYSYSGSGSYTMGISVP